MAENKAASDVVRQSVEVVCKHVKAGNVVADALRIAMEMHEAEQAEKPIPRPAAS